MAQVDIREIRLERLLVLLKQHAGLKVALAKAIGRAPAQVSQWCTGNRTISEDSARNIESKLRLPHGWMDRSVAEDSATRLSAEEPPSHKFSWPFTTTREEFDALPPAFQKMADDQLTLTVNAWKSQQMDSAPSGKRAAPA